MSDAEGDSIITCSGGGEITDAATTLKLACGLTDLDGDKMYFLVERTAEDAFAAGKGRLRSSGGTGKHAGREFECTYSFTYLPKLGGMSFALVTVRNRCKGDLHSWFPQRRYLFVEGLGSRGAFLRGIFGPRNPLGLERADFMS